jgi:hypothetical protein
MSREAIYSALFALVSQGEGQPGKITGAGGETLLFTSRRVKLFGDLPAQPALCQAEHGETYAQQTNLPYKRTFSASWLLYHTAGNDPSAVPSTTTNNLLDAIGAAITPYPNNPGYRQTLGGLVHHCFINGKVFRESGDLDGQALFIVPITLLIP